MRPLPLPVQDILAVPGRELVLARKFFVDLNLPKVQRHGDEILLLHGRLPRLVEVGAEVVQRIF